MATTQMGLSEFHIVTFIWDTYINFLLRKRGYYMFCGQCGTQVPDGQNICPACGNSLTAANNNYQQYFTADNTQGQNNQQSGQPVQGFEGQANNAYYAGGFGQQAPSPEQAPFTAGQGYQQAPQGQQMNGQMNGQINYPYGANQGYQQGMPNPGQQSYYQQPGYQGSFDFSKFLNTTINQFKAGIRPEALKAKMIAYIGLVVAFISLFLPAVTVSASFYGTYKESMSFISYNGPWVLVLILITAVLLICNYDKFALIPVGLSALFLVTLLFDVLTASSAVSVFGSVSLSFGFFILFLGLAAVPVYYFLPRFKKQ